jgi:glycosyltransferase involved in cell wall biosynthesis
LLKINKNKNSQLGVLYISYDGMMEPLGQSQVLAYLKQLAKYNRIYLISFEKEYDWARVTERNTLLREIAESGIFWYSLRYHNRPSVLATSFDIALGSAIGLWLIFRHNLKVVHARSYVPSVMVLLIKCFTHVKYLFDMRGFWADEKVDGGSWSQTGLLYRIVKRLEKNFLQQSDHVVSLTHAAVKEMKRFPYLLNCMPPVSVIPTCADLTRFTPMTRVVRRLISNSFVLGYVGSVGTYYLFDEVVACFMQLRLMRPEARLLIVNRGQHVYLRERLSVAGVPDAVVELTSATHVQMPSQIARMDAGIFFIKPVFSKQASAPTKLAEFLGCGIPCLGNAGVGDMAAVLEGENVGVAIASFDEESLKRGMERILMLVDDPGTSARCVAAALRHFSLDEGVARYRSIYDLLAR